MENIEDIKKIRALTLAPINKISDVLRRSNYDVNAAVALLVKEQATSAADMANRRADNSIVYSYVHNNKVGAMIVLVCQTDFVAKNEMFLKLAKEICMHIVSNTTCEYVDVAEVPGTVQSIFLSDCRKGLENKPAVIVDKILAGKLGKMLDEVCLLRQKFVKDNKTTIQQLIANVSATMGEKIEIKRFVRFSA